MGNMTRPDPFSQQKRCMPRQNELITRLGAGGQSGRAATAEKALERMREEGLVGKPFVPKKRSFAFPPVDRMGCACTDVASQAELPIMTVADFIFRQGTGSANVMVAGQACRRVPI